MMSPHTPLKPLVNLRLRTDQLIREPFPYYLDDPLKNTILSAAYSATVVILLAIMQNSFALKVAVVGLTTFAVLYVNIVQLPRWFPSLLDPRQWTVGKYIAFSWWQMFLCGIAIPVACHLCRIHPEEDFLTKMIAIFPKIFFYGAIPQIILTLVIRNFMLRQSLRQVKIDESTIKPSPGEVRRHDAETVQASEEIKGVPFPSLARIQSDTRETLEFPVRDWLYVEADDNYVTFYWASIAGIQKRMLRMNLKSAEEQLAYSRAFRCHRSYLVNLEAVDDIAGNANGYKLLLKNGGGPIPVSRGRSKEVVERLAEKPLLIHSPQNHRY